MFIYGKDQQAFHLERTQTEKWFSRINIILLAIQMICFISSIIRFSIYSGKIMANSFFTRGQLRIDYQMLDKNCQYLVNSTLGVFRNLQYNVSVKNLEYIVDRNALDLRYLWAVSGLCLVLSTINFIWYEVNAHEIRYHFVVFHKDMITTWQVALLLIGLIMNISVQKQNQVLDDFYLHCVDIPVGYSVRYSPLTPLFEFYVFFIASLAILGINGLFSVVNLLRKNPREVFLREEAEQLEMWKKKMETQGQRSNDMMQPQAMPPHDSITQVARDHTAAAHSISSLSHGPLHSSSFQYPNATHEHGGFAEDKNTSLSGTHDGLLYSSNLNINQFGDKHDGQDKNAGPPEKNPHMATSANGGQMESHLREQLQGPPVHRQLSKDKPSLVHHSGERGGASKTAVSDDPSKVLNLYEDQPDVVVEDDKLQDTVLGRHSLSALQTRRNSHDRDITEGERDLPHNPSSSVLHSPKPQHPGAEALRGFGDGSDMDRSTHERGITHRE